MSDRLPSLKALRLFEAAGRRLSYRRAAEELFLTHGAVSHQIKVLEGELGTKLFRRAGRTMQLTEDGQRLYVAMHEAMALITNGVASLRPDGRPQTLNISATPSIATWLAPRLADFCRHYPQLDVSFNAAIAIVDFNQEEVDLALRYGSGKWPDVCAERVPLGVIEYLAVCSPAYRSGRLPEEAQELRRCVLIHHPFMSWVEWFRSAGADVDAPIGGPRFNEYPLAVQAAIAGQGVMLANEILVAEELASGRLVRLERDQRSLRKSAAYYIVYPDGRDLPSKVRLFRDWLLDQARESTSEESHTRDVVKV